MRFMPTPRVQKINVDNIRISLVWVRLLLNFGSIDESQLREVLRHEVTTDEQLEQVLTALRESENGTRVRWT